MTIKLFTVNEMVAAEKAADAAGLSYAQMMETAGLRVAEAIQQRYDVAGRRILILVGPGNNGGDGLVAGRYLARMGANVAFYLLKPRLADDDDNLARVAAMGLELTSAEQDPRTRALHQLLQAADIVVDALLGTGASRPITGLLADLIRYARTGIDERRKAPREKAKMIALAAPLPSVGEEGGGGREGRRLGFPVVVAVDCPSGLNCDSGELDPLTIPSDLTITFAGPKRGHFRFPGAATCGELVVADIGIDDQLPEVSAISIDMATNEMARGLLPPRPPDGHKGTFGTALIVAGSIRYWGAPSLAARGAFRSGAGLVALAVPQRLRPALAGQFPEAIYPPVTDTDLLGVTTANLLADALKDYSAILIGPGLGDAGTFMEAALDGLRRSNVQRVPPLVVDADGLNLLSAMADWPNRLPQNSILTPHPGEMARLIGCSLEVIRESDRIQLVREKAVEWGHVVVLKGAYTVIAAPDGRVVVLPFANPLLAVGGSGDVLAGITVGLLAQGMHPFEAAVLAGYLHGAAGEMARDQWGDAGLLASELADWVSHARRALN